MTHPSAPWSGLILIAHLHSGQYLLPSRICVLPIRNIKSALEQSRSSAQTIVAARQSRPRHRAFLVFEIWIETVGGISAKAIELRVMSRCRIQRCRPRMLLLREALRPMPELRAIISGSTRVRQAAETFSGRLCAREISAQSLAVLALIGTISTISFSNSPLGRQTRGVRLIRQRPACLRGRDCLRA